MDKQYYPLTTGQQITYVSQKWSLKKSIVDICVLFTMNQELDEKLLTQSIYMAMLRNDSSRVRLHKQEDKTIAQYLSEDGPEAILKLDYSDKTEEEFQADVNKWSQTPFPHSSMDCQLYKIYLIRRPDKRQALYFCVSHLAFDAVALMYVASDMLQIYQALCDGTPIPPCKGDYMKLCETDWEYLKSDKRQKDLEFWMQEIDTEPLLAPVNPAKMKLDKGKRSGKVVNLLNSTAHHYNHKIEAELVDKVNAMALELRVSPQLLFLLGVRSYLSRVNNNQEDVTVYSPVARRATLLEKRSGGTRVLAPLFRMNMSQDTTVTEALKRMSAQQKRIYPHTNIPFTDVSEKVLKSRFSHKATSGYASMSITYNPFGVQAADGFDFEMQTYSNGANSMPVYLTIMALDNSGALNCNYDCIDAFADAEVAAAIHEQLVKALTRMTEAPDCTLAELNTL